MKKSLSLNPLFFCLLISINMYAGWQDMLNGFVEKSTESETGSTESIEHDALRAALEQGVSYAVKRLGEKNGYFDDEKVKILLPEGLAKLEPIIRQSGGDEIVDELVLSMNDSATEAAPKTVEIFFSAIKSMSISDAQSILQAEDNALTEYFRKSSYQKLEHLIKPIVTKMMDKNKVSYYYKQVRNSYQENESSIPYRDNLLNVGKSFGLDAYVPPKELDQYVTKKAIDGLFIKISEEEKKIRDNPLVQKSKLIRDVFGSI